MVMLSSENTFVPGCGSRSHEFKKQRSFLEVVSVHSVCVCMVYVHLVCVFMVCVHGLCVPGVCVPGVCVCVCLACVPRVPV